MADLEAKVAALNELVRRKRQQEALAEAAAEAAQAEAEVDAEVDAEAELGEAQAEPHADGKPKARPQNQAQPKASNVVRDPDTPEHLQSPERSNQGTLPTSPCIEPTKIETQLTSAVFDVCASIDADLQEGILADNEPGNLTTSIHAYSTYSPIAADGLFNHGNAAPPLISPRTVLTGTPPLHTSLAQTPPYTEVQDVHIGHDVVQAHGVVQTGHYDGPNSVIVPTAGSNDVDVSMGSDLNIGASAVNPTDLARIGTEGKVTRRVPSSTAFAFAGERGYMNESVMGQGPRCENEFENGRPKAAMDFGGCEMGIGGDSRAESEHGNMLIGSNLAGSIFPLHMGPSMGYGIPMATGDGHARGECEQVFGFDSEFEELDLGASATMFTC